MCKLITKAIYFSIPVCCLSLAPRYGALRHLDLVLTAGVSQDKSQDQLTLPGHYYGFKVSLPGLSGGAGWNAT